MGKKTNVGSWSDINNEFEKVKNLIAKNHIEIEMLKKDKGELHGKN